MAVKVEPSLQYSIKFYFQIAAEEQSDKMASNMKVCMKQKCINEFLHEEKMAPIDINQCLLNVSRDQPVAVSMARHGWCISAVTAATVDQILWYRFL